MKIRFGYPRRGLQGRFNTFRLGLGMTKQVIPGDQVELVDSRSEKLLKRAMVTAVHTGPLDEMALQHAHQAHNWKAHPPEDQAALLVASMKKRYPPGRVNDRSPVTVIYLEEIPDEQRSNDRPE